MSGRLALVHFVALAALTAPALACAQDLVTSLDEVVVTATRTPAPLEKVSSSITVVQASQIELEQVRTLPDLLKTVPGLNVVQTGGAGDPTSVFMRGTNSNHVKVLIDGMDVSDPSTPNGAYDFAHILTDDIARVEVLRGPQSGLYGSDAIGGVISVITKDGEGPLSGHVSLEGGSFDTFNQTAGFSGQSGGFHYVLDLDHVQVGSTPVTPPDLLAPGEALLDDAYDNRTVSTKLRYDVTPDFDVGLVARSTETQLRFTGEDYSVYPAIPASQQSSESTQQYYARLSADLRMFDGAFDQTVGLAYSSDDRWDYTYPVAPPDPERYHGDRLKLDWQGDIQLAQGETVTLGAESEHDRYLSPVTASEDINAGYAELQSTLAGNLSDAASIRIDSNNRFGEALTYRLAPTYLIAATGTKLNASLGTGFKAPSLDELYDNYPAYGFYANPDLKPERDTGYDFGFEQFLQGRKASFGLTYFHNSIKDLIDDNATFTTDINIGKARTYGAEAFAAYAPTQTLSFRLDYTYTVAEDEDLHEELLRRPKTKVSLQSDWRPLSKLGLSGTVIYIGPDIDGNRDFSIPRLWAPGYVTADAAATYDLTSQLSVFGRVTNLADRKYQNPIGYMAPGRGLYIGVKAKL
jgi:vitamin B12 transporter